MQIREEHAGLRRGHFVQRRYKVVPSLSLGSLATFTPHVLPLKDRGETMISVSAGHMSPTSKEQGADRTHDLLTRNRALSPPPPPPPPPPGSDNTHISGDWGIYGKKESGQSAVCWPCVGATELTCFGLPWERQVSGLGSRDLMQ